MPIFSITIIDMLAHLSITQNILVFIFSGAIIWFFSNKLSKVVEFIDDAFSLGDAFGGTIILSIVTNLPELVIVITGSIKGDTSIALGNILGGIAMQTLLLTLFDFASRKERKPLMTLSSNSNSIVQGVFLCVILGLVIMGSQLNSMFVMHRISPIEVLILGTWILCLIVLRKRTGEQPLEKEKTTPVKSTKITKRKGLFQLVIISVIILFFGVLLADTSDTISDYYNLSGVVFGATVLAFVTSLPEISGGIAFVRQKRYVPIISDIFGGNAFLPVLFFLANLIAGHSILTDAHKTDIYITALSLVLVCIYLIGMVIKPQKRATGMGIESWIALIVYSIGILGLLLV